VDCPVELGSEYDVEISQMSPNGEGMANFKGFWVFVRNVKLGEMVKVRITFLDSISADAEVISRTRCVHDYSLVKVDVFNKKKLCFGANIGSAR
jgi:predicted RNA-binding protein with TRAM domain